MSHSSQKRTDLKIIFPGTSFPSLIYEVFSKRNQNKDTGLEQLTTRNSIPLANTGESQKHYGTNYYIYNNQWYGQDEQIYL